MKIFRPIPILLTTAAVLLLAVAHPRPCAAGHRQPEAGKNDDVLRAFPFDQWPARRDKLAARYIEAELPKGMKDIKRVVVPSFKIEIATAAMVWSSTITAVPSLRAELSGPDDEELQALTDMAYQELTQKLLADGFNVVERKELLASSVYQSLSGWAKPEPFPSASRDMETDTGVESRIFAPTEFFLYFKSVEPEGDALGIVRDDSPESMEPEMVRLWHAAVIDVRFRVNFTGLDINRGLFRSRKEPIYGYDPGIIVSGVVRLLTPNTVRIVQLPFNRGVKVFPNDEQPVFTFKRDIILPGKAPGFRSAPLPPDTSIAADSRFTVVADKDAYLSAAERCLTMAIDLLSRRLAQARDAFALSDLK